MTAPTMTHTNAPPQTAVRSVAGGDGGVGAGGGAAGSSGSGSSGSGTARENSVEQAGHVIAPPKSFSLTFSSRVHSGHRTFSHFFTRKPSRRDRERANRRHAPP